MRTCYTAPGAQLSPLWWSRWVEWGAGGRSKRKGTYICMWLVHFVVQQKLAQCAYFLSHVWLWDPVDCSPPGPLSMWILQERILEWVGVSFSRGSSQPRDPTQVSHTAGGFLPSEPPGNPSTVLWSNYIPNKTLSVKLKTSDKLMWIILRTSPNQKENW